MLDPQMLFNLMNGNQMNNMFGNLFSGANNLNGNQPQANNNPFANILGGNSQLLSGLMQMFSSQQNNVPQNGKNVYINKNNMKNNNINTELYNILKNSNNIL